MLWLALDCRKTGERMGLVPIGKGEMELEKVIVSWSSGKDSALALYEVMHNPDFDVIGLLTTIDRSTDRISMHLSLIHI